jgi:hypothetical protein
VPRDPSLALGATKKGASGRQKRAPRGDKKGRLGATKKGASGRQQEGLHKNIFSTASRERLIDLIK